MVGRAVWGDDLGLAQAHGDGLVGDGDVVPGESDDVLDLLAEHDDQDGGGAVTRVQLFAVDCRLHGLILFSSR
jgi:hypothetical protein